MQREKFYIMPKILSMDKTITWTKNNLEYKLKQKLILNEYNKLYNNY